MSAMGRKRVAEGIYERNGVFQVAVYDSEKKGTSWISGLRSLEEAQTVRADALEEKRRRKRLGKRETVADFASRWMRDFPRPARSTAMYHNAEIRHLVRDFGDLNLRDLDRVRARQWALEHRSSLNSARAMFSDARLDGLVDDNPFAKLKISSGSGRRDIVVLSPAEVGELARCAQRKFGEYGEQQFGALIVTAAYTGMRNGELYALRWQDVDFQNDLIHVRHSWQSKSKEMKAPKTGEERTIVMSPQARHALLLARKVQQAHGLVFWTKRGKRFSGRVHHYYWDPVRTMFLDKLPADHPLRERKGRDASRGDLEFYDLRHFCASYLLDIGVSREDVAVQLGHTDGGKLVGELYGHMSEELARARIRENMLRGYELPRKSAG